MTDLGWFEMKIVHPRRTAPPRPAPERTAQAIPRSHASCAWYATEGIGGGRAGGENDFSRIASALGICHHTAGHDADSHYWRYDCMGREEYGIIWKEVWYANERVKKRVYISTWSFRQKAKIHFLLSEESLGFLHTLIIFLYIRICSPSSPFTIHRYSQP